MNVIVNEKTTDEASVTKDVETTESPKSLDDYASTSIKSMLGMSKKKPRAEYQAEIDDLKEENERLSAELDAVKAWLANAPKF